MEAVSDLLTAPLRAEDSMVSGLVAAFSTLALGGVPRGAIFITTPCLSIFASANDGLGGASCGSILEGWSAQLCAHIHRRGAKEAHHLSMNVLGRSTAPPAGLEVVVAF
jgi:hypothetical protein